MKKLFIFILFIFISFSFSSCNLTETKNYIFFNTNCEEVISKIEINDNVSLPEPHQEGFKFLGWYIDEELNTKIDSSYFSSKLNTNVVLYAKWEESNEVSNTNNTIKAYYIIGNGFRSIIEEIKNETIENKLVQKEGYNFLGWYADNKLTEKFNFSQKFTDNTFLYAKWEPITYIVNFYDANNEIFKSLNVEYNGSVVINEYPTKEGYYFTSWDKSFENIKSNLDIYPVFEHCSLKVTVYDNFTNELKSFYTNYGNKISKSQILVEKDNYNFIDFYTDSNFTKLFDFDKEIKDYTTIYALYEIKKFDVTFYTEDNEIYNKQVVEYGKNAVIYSYPIKEGYDFVSWDEEYSFVDKNLDIFPVYKIHSYTVKYLSNVENTSFDALVEYNNLINKPTVTQLDSHNFIGFYTDPDYLTEYDFTLPVMQDTIIYLKYEIKKFKVTFVILSDLDIYNEQIVEYGSSAVEPNFESNVKYKDITFLGWVEDFTNVTCDLIIHAKYESKYAYVSFVTNGGTEIDALKILKGNKIDTLKSTYKKYYTLDGFYKDKELTNLFNTEESIYANITLYAKWTPTVYNVEYELNGGYFKDEYVSTFTIEETVTLIEPFKDYHSFLGFYLTSDFDESSNITKLNKEALENINFNDDVITIYAKWDDVEVFYYNNFVYKVVNNEITIIDYLDSSVSTLFVPNIINGKTVTNIDSKALDNINLTTIFLPINLNSVKFDSFNNSANLYFTSSDYTNIPLLSYTNANIPFELINDNYFSNFNDLTYYVNYFGEIVTNEINSESEYINFLSYALLNKFTDFSLTINFTQSLSILQELFVSYINKLLFSTNVSSYNIKQKSNNIFNITFYYTDGELASVSASNEDYFTQLNGFYKKFDNNYISEFPIDKINKLYYVENTEELFLAVMNGFNPQILDEKTLNIYNTARNILSQIISVNMTDFEKAYAIYNYLILNVTYDYDIYNLLETDTDMKKYKAFYLEGVFEDKRAVCDGLSKAFVLMCGIEGIKSIKVVGNANSETNSNVGHAWNKVCIDDIWYVVDTTSGNAIYQDKKLEILSNGYLFISDEEYLQDYVERGEYPKAIGHYNIYADLDFDFENNNYDLIISSQEEFNVFISYFLSCDFESIDCKIDFDIGDLIQDEFKEAFEYAKNNNYVDSSLSETYAFNIIDDVYVFIKLY